MKLWIPSSSFISLHVLIYIHTYIYIYVKIAEPLPLVYVTKLQSLLRGQLNWFRYIFDINRLPCTVACFTLLIIFTKILPHWYLISKHYHSNTVNVFRRVSAASFPSVKGFRNSPKKIYLKHKFEKGYIGSIPLTLVLIGRDGLSTLCHSCEFG